MNSKNKIKNLFQIKKFMPIYKIKYNKKNKQKNKLKIKYNIKIKNN